MSAETLHQTLQSLDADTPGVRDMDKERRRQVRLPMRCPRVGCRGQLYAEADVAGHVLELKCILCAHSAGGMTSLTAVGKHGMSWQDVDKACRQTVPFLWVRVTRIADDRC